MQLYTGHSTDYHTGADEIMTARKIVLTTFGSLGDLHPFIAVALQLRRHGHRPVIASSPDYREKVEGEGIEFCGVGPSVAQVRGDLRIDEQEFVRRTMTDKTFLLKQVTFPYLKVMYEDMLDVIAGAAVVITSTFAFSARLAAEKHAIPQIGVILQPLMFLSPYDPPILADAQVLSKMLRRCGPTVSAAVLQLAKSITARWTAPVAALRKELGLPATSINPVFEGQFSEHGALGFYSPVLGAIQPDFPRPTKLTGFLFYDADAREDAAEGSALAAFLSSGPSPLVFVLGSFAISNAGDFFRVSVQAASQLGRRAVIVVGSSAPKSEIENLPSHVFACRYAAYSKLFPYAAAIVHQGGIGTTAQALRAGKAQLVVPFLADQPDNAARVVRLGVARTISRGRYRAKRVARELAQLLNEPAYANRAAVVAEQVRGEDGAGEAAIQIERVVNERQGTVD